MTRFLWLPRDIFSPAGRLIFPPLSLGSPLSFLESNTQAHLAAVSSDGLLFAWNVLQQRATITAQPINLSPPSPGHNTPHVSHLLLGDNGLPVVICGSHSYLFHTDMNVWMKVDSSHTTGAPVDGFLSKLLSSVDNSNRGSVLALTQEPNDSVLGGGVVSLEGHLAISLAVGSSVEYKYWLLTYARHLTTDGDTTRLTELCHSLLGPPVLTSTRVPGKNWEPTVLGLSKRELLRELLPIMSTNRSLQRLVVQFREGLDGVVGVGK